MRVLVLGGGYAGLSLARTLERRLDDGVELLLVDEDGTHCVQHELHRVVRRPDLADDITLDLASTLDRTSVRIGTVASIDPDGASVDLEGGDRIDADVVAVAVGAGPSLAVPGVEAHAFPLKRIEHARRIHAAATEAIEGQRARIVVGGAGLSGVQVAGELAALAGDSGVEVGDRADDGSAPITLLEQAQDVAPGFDEPFQAAIHAALEERGIEVRTGATVVRATETAVDLGDGERVEHDLLVWTGGIAGRAALDGQRPRVDATLRLGERGFGLGDAVRVVDRDGQAVPATAQAAVSEADTVATNVERLLAGDDWFDPRLERFAFDSPGWVVSVGDGAVAKVGPTVVTGRAAVALKTSVGVGYLSSVSGLRDAVDLVNEELGLAVGDR